MGEECTFQKWALKDLIGYRLSLENLLTKSHGLVQVLKDYDNLSDEKIQKDSAWSCYPSIKEAWQPIKSFHNK